MQCVLEKWGVLAVEGCAGEMRSCHVQERDTVPATSLPTRNALDHSIKYSEQGCKACPGRTNLCSIWEVRADSV